MIAVLSVVGSGWFGYERAIRGNEHAVGSAETAKQPLGGGLSTASASQRQGVAAPRPDDATATPRSTSPALAWPFWEFKFRQPIPPRDPPLTPVPWRMIGATQSNGVWSILILRQGKTSVEYYKVGDSLPGDYRVSAITEEDVTLVKDRKAIVLSYIGSR